MQEVRGIQLQGLKVIMATEIAFIHSTTILTEDLRFGRRKESVKNI